MRLLPIVKRTKSNLIKKLIALSGVLIVIGAVHAQKVATIGTVNSTTNTSGLGFSTTSGERVERHTCIYSVAELTAAGMTGNDLIYNIAWEKTGAASYTGTDLTIRIWLKHVATTTFAANPTFLTETGSATQVYETTTGTLPATAGWLNFNFNMTTFTWNGGDNIQVITELVRPTSWTATTFSWRTIPTVTNAAATTSGTTASVPATLTRSGIRPQVRFEIAAPGHDAALVRFPNPVSAPPGIQPLQVVLRNTGNSILNSADISWSINGGAPTVYAWAGSLAIGDSTTLSIGSYNFPLGQHAVQASITSANGLTDQGPTNNVVSKNVIICNALAGNYTINKLMPTGGTNFASFNDFANYLTSCGVSGHVTASVQPGSGPYKEQVIFRDINGLGAGTSVTIIGNGEIITSDTALANVVNRHIIRLKDLSYFTIRGLKVNMVASSTSFMGIHVFNTGNHINISDNEINMTGTSVLSQAVLASGSETSNLVAGTFQEITFKKNTATGGGYGVSFMGTASTGILIDSNTIYDFSGNGIYTRGTDGLIISGNTLNKRAGAVGANAIQLAQGDNANALIYQNRISHEQAASGTFRGIYVFGGTGHKVYNNLIHDLRATTGTAAIGIAVRAGAPEVSFNTVSFDNTNASVVNISAFAEDGANTGTVLRNNIFSIIQPTTGTKAAIALNTTSVVTTGVNSNRNVFWVPGGNVASRGTTLYNALADWQTASLQDANSFQTDPTFQAGTGIPTNGTINNQGATIGYVTLDIAGVVRSGTPDPGAYEFTPSNDDAAITDFIVPALPHCANTLDVQFELTNSGAVPLNSVVINWTVNGVAQTPFSWNGPSIAPGASTIVTLGNVPVTGSNTYAFSATSSLPNGNTDVNAANNSFTYNGFRRGMNGVFTIDGGSPVSSTNYQTFQSIADDLSLYGVCGAVTINVMNGPYTSQVVFDSIPGTSATNTVTLNGNNQLLQFNPTVSSADHILKLNNVTHMIVENLHITSLHATQGRGIHITNGTSKTVIRNNTINVSLTNTESSAFGIIISGVNYLLDGSFSDSVIIEGNTVTGGFSAIQLTGEHWTTPLTRIRVRNNNINDWSTAGVYLNYTDGVIVENNRISRPVRNNTESDSQSPAGVVITAGSINFMVDRNRIFNLQQNMTGSSISRGIYISGTTTAPTSGTVQNNLIYGFTNDGAQYGIQNNSTVGPINIYHNTIVLDGGAGTGTTNAIYLSNSTTQNGTSIRNNLFFVSRGGTGVKRIFEVSSGNTVFTSNNNAIWLDDGANPHVFGRVGGVDYSTIGDWQVGEGQDLNSVPGNPNFVNPATGNYKPGNFDLDGTLIQTFNTGVAIDIEGSPRHATTPDPGAYEFAAPVCTGANGGTAASTTTSLCGSGSAVITALGFTTGGTVAYQWQYSTDNFVADVHDLAGQVTPASATTGIITATTYYRLKVTCAAATATAYSNIVTITVVPTPVTTISYAASPYCTNAGTASVTHTGTTGGTYSSTAGLNIDASTGAVALATSTAGTYTVTYTVPASGGCPIFTTTATITITAAPTATISYAGSPYCSNSGTATVTRTGTTGGVFTSTTGLNINAATGEINLAGSTAGNYIVTYTVAATGGCATFVTTAPITVTQAPVATIAYAGSPYCNTGTATPTLFGTNGGTYASTAGLVINASTGAINLATSTPGTYTVSYSIAAAGGCSAFITSGTVTITAAPVATISYATPMCINSGTANVTLTGSTGGVFSSATGLVIDASSGAINTSTSTAGAYTVSYTIAAGGGCGNYVATVPVSIAAGGSWTGATSSDWNTASNWCGGIPTSTTDVVIPTTAPNMPNLSAGTGAARSITISNGATVTIGTSGILELYGNITGAGNFNATTGSINFRGATAQTVPGFNATNVTMNGTGGVTISGNTAITGSLTLTNGNFTIAGNNLTLSGSSTGSIASHIITNGTGRVIVSNLAASQSRIVPVSSDATSYTPITLTANAGHVTDNFQVRVQTGVHANGVSGQFIPTHVVDRQWFVSESTPNGSDVNVQVQWSGAQELQSFVRAKSYIMHFNGSTWVTGTATPAAGSDPYTQVKNNVTSFSAFAVQTQPIPRPITGIYPNPTTGGFLNVVTDLPGEGPVVFSIYDSKGRLVYRNRVALSTGLSQTRLEIRHLAAGVYVLKVSTNTESEFNVQRFVKIN